MSQKTIEELAAQTLRDSQAMIARAERLLQENEERMRAAGLDPAKVRALGLRDLDDEHIAKLEAQLKADEEEIERNARHAIEGQDSAGASTRTKHSHKMI